MNLTSFFPCELIKRARVKRSRRWYPATVQRNTSALNKRARVITDDPIAERVEALSDWAIGRSITASMQTDPERVIGTPCHLTKGAVLSGREMLSLAPFGR